MLYLQTTLRFQEKDPGPLLSRHIEEWSGRRGARCSKRCGLEVRAGLVMAHLKSARSVATSIGLDMLMCLVGYLGEDAN